MVLKRLEMTGFKSFATRTVFEFRPGVTAIVGPNGSGKSNFADAVRWVLGEQSLSQLRCRRTEELLYGGGGRRPPAGLAEVALTIDNSTRTLPVDFDEVTLTRRLVRSGENEYFINRARVRLRDLQQAAAPLGGSYTLLNQGLVDAALALRPEERRRLFEDAAEIGGFEQRRQDALRRLRETAANLVRVDDLLAELEPRLRALKRQSAQAEQYRTLQQQLQQLRVRWHRAQWQAACRRRDEARAAADAALAALASAQAAEVSVAAELEQLRLDSAELRAQLTGLLQQRTDVSRRLQQQDRAQALLAERIRLSAVRRADLARQLEDADLTQRDLEQQETDAARQLDELGHQAQLDAEALTGAEAALRPAADQVVQVQQGWRSAHDRALAAARNATVLRSQLEQVETQIRRLRDQSATLQADDEAGRPALLAAESLQQQAETTLQQAAAEAAQAAEREQQAREQLAQARAQRSAAEELRAQLRRELADLQARLETLTRLQRANSGVFAGVRAALEWAERQARPGFVLVQRLLQTPAEYETAVEVALGGRLQYVVVDAWRDAEQAIAELRRSGVGRATFLPLDTLQVGRRERRPPADNDGVFGVAADLVPVDERYRPVRDQLLGRLLLVRDLAVARREVRLLPPGWQIATLVGDLVNSGGAVSGGAPVREQGALRREREGRELPAEITAAEARLAEADRQRSAADRAVQAAQTAVQAAEQLNTDLRGRLSRLAQERDSADRRRADLSDQRARRAARLAEADRDAAQLTARLDQLQRDLAAAEREVVQAEAAQHQLQQQVDGLRGAEQQLRDRVNRLRSERSGLTARLQSASAARDAVRRRLAQLAESRQRTLSVLQELERALEVLAAESAELQAVTVTLQQEDRRLQQLIGPLELEVLQQQPQLAAAEDILQQQRSALAAAERAAAQAQSDVQRQNDRVDAVFERAAADEVDPEQPRDDDDLPPVSATELDELRQRLARYGSVNLLALEEYREVAERHGFLATQAADLRAADQTLQTLIGELEQAIDGRFQQTFNAVAEAFTTTFPRLFGGGSAQLQLVSARPAADGESGPPVGRNALGVEVLAQPPGKRRQPISLLSGGERSLTAVALLFAILQVNPSPFCILDETDAALDESNVGRFRAMFAELSSQTQFVLITHNRGTVEAADQLYGVTLADDGSSRVISLQIAQYTRDTE